MTEPKSRVSTVITERDVPGPDENVLARTKASEPNIDVITLPWWQMIVIRASRVYLQSMLGFLTASATGIADAIGVPLGQFGNIFVTSASLAVAPAAISLIQNTVEILTKLDITNPQLRA